MSNLVTKEVEFNGASLMAVQIKDDGKVHYYLAYAFCPSFTISLHHSAQGN